MARISWTYEMIAVEALKYDTRWAFQTQSKAYAVAKYRGIVDEVCTHMTLVRPGWSDETLVSEALKYETRTAFQRGCSVAYQAARERGLLDAICGHMDVVRVLWTDEMIRAEALKYNTRKAFSRASNAYTVAMRRGVLDDVCAHMVSGYAQLEGPTVVYFLTVLSRDGSGIFYKVGLSKNGAQGRYAGHGAIFEVQAEVTYPTRAAAFAEERRLIRKYRQYLAPADTKWSNSTGAAELFTIDIYALEHFAAQKMAA